MSEHDHAHGHSHGEHDHGHSHAPGNMPAPIPAPAPVAAPAPKPAAAHNHGHSHSHSHSHGHSHGPITITGPETELDPAHRSLGEALRTSFGLLKWVMLILVIAFAFSGWFHVKEDQVAVRTRFGKVLGEPGQQVLPPGGPYFGLPTPIDQVYFVPTRLRSVELGKAFWFKVAPEDIGKKLDELALPTGGLNPGEDGALLTSDQNIVHAKFTINYTIKKEQAAEFLQQVGLRKEELDPKTKKLIRPMDGADELVRWVAEQAIVHVAARTSSDEFSQGNFPRKAAQAKIQAELDRMHAGITVADVLVADPTPPLAARKSFQMVTEAESEKAQKMEGAEQGRSRILNESAGAGYRSLLAVLDQYEIARRKNDTTSITLLESSIQALLDGATAEKALAPIIDSIPDAVEKKRWSELATPDQVRGEAFRVIAEAKTYRANEAKKVQAEMEKFTKLLPLYTENPEIYRDRLWQEAMREILSGDVETFYLPAGQKELYLDLSRDPNIRKKREQEKYQQENKDKKPAPK